MQTTQPWEDSWKLVDGPAVLPGLDKPGELHEITIDGQTAQAHHIDVKVVSGITYHLWKLTDGTHVVAKLDAPATGHAGVQCYRVSPGAWQQIPTMPS